MLPIAHVAHRARGLGREPQWGFGGEAPETKSLVDGAGRRQDDGFACGSGERGQTEVAHVNFDGLVGDSLAVLFCRG